MAKWRRNLYVLFAVQVLSVAGFSLVFPFLPLYVGRTGRGHARLRRLLVRDGILFPRVNDDVVLPDVGGIR